MSYAFEGLGPILRYVVLGFLLIFALIALLFIVFLAALPGWIAKRNAHPQASAINVCGLLGLPTGVLWVIAMVWAYTVRPSVADAANPISAKQLDEQIKHLEQTLESLEKRFS